MVTPLGCSRSSNADDYSMATRFSYWEPDTIPNPSPLPSHIETSFSLLNGCKANDLYDTTGKLLLRRPGRFLVYGYNRQTGADENLLLQYIDRADGYLAYVGPNNTHMRQVQNTSGDLNLYFRPGEQVLLYVNCIKDTAPAASPYFVFYSRTNYIQPVTLPLYTYTLPKGWEDFSTKKNNTETLGKLS